MELELLAESESDSDSEIHSTHDNNSVQRSAVTAATAGSEPGQGMSSHTYVPSVAVLLSL